MIIRLILMLLPLDIILKRDESFNFFLEKKTKIICYTVFEEFKNYFTLFI